MKSFKTFLLESKSSPAPQGVLFYGDKIIVGVEHETQVKIKDEELVKKIQTHGKKHGFYYEGNGGDAKQEIFDLKSMKDYAGGYDKDFNKSQKEFPYQHFTLLISNTNVNKPWNWITKAGSNGKHSMFDAILKAGFGKILDLPEPKEEHLTKFLRRASSGGNQDYLKLFKETPATEKNARKILQDMENLGYEHKNEDGEYDWKTGKLPLQVLSREAEDLRNNYILDKAKPGVYLIGAGHLDSMRRILKGRDEDHEMIGGEKIE